jgi:isochorismate pyruvate lyase
MKPPAACADMRDVREAIDALDDRLVALIAERARYSERAAALKPALGIPALAPERVSEVLSRVEARAAAVGAPGDLALTLWRAIIEWSIERERALMREHGGDAPRAAPDETRPDGDRAKRRARAGGTQS